MDNEEEKAELQRREFVRDSVRGGAVVALTLFAGSLLPKGAKADEMVWQINPHKCTECGKCETHCVLKRSAVKAVHAFGLCGFCDLCTAYFKPEPFELNEGAENHMCPTNAIERRYVEAPYYEYKINEDFCVGCAKCVDGCHRYGNGSMHLQIQHDLCLDCDACAINNACPSDAFVKVPASTPYLFKGEESTWHQ